VARAAKDHDPYQRNARQARYREIHIVFCADNLKAKEALAAANRAVDHRSGAVPARG
jgi:hypothetical protein